MVPADRSGGREGPDDQAIQIVTNLNVAVLSLDIAIRYVNNAAQAFAIDDRIATQDLQRMAVTLCEVRKRADNLAIRKQRGW